MEQNHLRNMRGDEENISLPLHSLNLEEETIPFPGIEEALSIDHILESILASLDRNTLLLARLVSPRWKYFATKELHAMVSLEFRLKKKTAGEGSRQPALKGKYCLHRQDYERKFTVRRLHQVMTHSELFPCTYFKFFNAHVPIRDLNLFFDSHGARIKTLELGEIEIDSFRKIVLLQAPNLENLILRGPVQPPISLFETQSDRYDRTLTTDEDEDLSSARIHFRKYCNLITSQKLNLKTLTIEDHVYSNIVQDILQASPKLERVEFGQHSAWSNYYPTLLAMQINRLHLLKTLRISVGFSQNSMRPYETLERNHEGKLALEKLILGDLSPRCRGSQNSLNVITKIIIACSASASVKTVGWTPCGEIERFFIPKMCFVTTLIFSLLRCSSTKELFFPKGTNLSVVFPALKYVEFVEYWSKFADVEFCFEESQVVPSVQRVSLCAHLFDNHCFRRVFPNATFYKMPKVPVVLFKCRSIW